MMVELREYKDEIEPMSRAIGQAVLNFYKNQALKIPQGEHRIYAALNALATVAGMVIAGTGMDPKAMQFFADAVVQQAVAQFDKDDGRDGAGDHTTH